jgi:hypothetical protein
MYGGLFFPVRFLAVLGFLVAVFAGGALFGATHSGAIVPCKMSDVPPLSPPGQPWFPPPGGR